jgi:glutamate-5-semialdehyde dehydrogenase
MKRREKMTEYSELQSSICSMAKKARIAARSLTPLSSEKKNMVLLHMAELLQQQKEYIQQENKKDLVAGREKGLNAAMLDRLELSDKVIESMVSGLRAVAGLPLSLIHI